MTSEQAVMILERLDAVGVRMEESLVVMGQIQGYLIFFILVILLYFVYKFFRIFF